MSLRQAKENASKQMLFTSEKKRLLAYFGNKWAGEYLLGYFSSKWIESTKQTQDSETSHSVTEKPQRITNSSILMTSQDCYGFPSDAGDSFHTCSINKHHLMHMNRNLLFMTKCCACALYTSLKMRCYYSNDNFLNRPVRLKHCLEGSKQCYWMRRQGWMMAGWKFRG